MNRISTTILSVASLTIMAVPAMARSVDWQKKVATKIVAQQVYPRVAQMRGQQGTAKVRLSINAAGAVESVELATSSGSPVLDREAMDLVRRAGPYPAPPGGAAVVTVPITWRLI